MLKESGFSQNIFLPALRHAHNFGMEFSWRHDDDRFHILIGDQVLVILIPAFRSIFEGFAERLLRNIRSCNEVRVGRRLAK